MEKIVMQTLQVLPQSHVIWKIINRLKSSSWHTVGPGIDSVLSRFSRVRLCATPETAAHQAPLSLGFSRQEHWSVLPFPSPIHESEKCK